MRTKAHLLEGEMWIVKRIIEPFDGYGAIKYVAYSLSEWYEKPFGPVAEVEFYLYAPCGKRFDVEKSFVIWDVRQDFGTVITNVMMVGSRTEFISLDILKCSRWEKELPNEKT